MTTGNLPTPATPLVGRRRATRDLATQLARTRLVTLSGPGGCGKTRLALHVADTVASRFPAGAWWCDLGPLADPALVTQAVAASLGVQDAAARGYRGAGSGAQPGQRTAVLQLQRAGTDAACSYDAGKDAANNAYFAYAVVAPTSDYASNRPAQPQMVAGLGDEAFFVDGPDARQLWVLLNGKAAVMVAIGDVPNEAGSKTIAQLVVNAVQP